MFGGETVDEWYSLSGPQGDGKEGVLNLVTSFTPVGDVPAPIAPTDQPQPQQESAIRQLPQVSDELVLELAEMFPSIDAEVIRAVAESKGADKGATVNALIEIGNN